MTETLPFERMHGSGCSCTKCVGFQPGNVHSLRHGLDSERSVVPIMRNQRRRVLRQTGLRVSDLDPIGRAHLEMFCRSSAKLVLIDKYIEEHGLVRDDGSLPPCMTVYVSLTNSARSSLRALAEHLRKTDPEYDFAAALTSLSEGA